MNAKKLSQVALAYQRSQPAREALQAVDAVRMECVEDKSGVVVERWYAQTSLPTELQQRVVNVVIFATPHWWEVFTPITQCAETAATVAAIKALAPPLR
jgi:hypothetical protein